MLLYLEELSYKEIAEIIGVSASNVGVKYTESLINYKNNLKISNMETNELKNIWKSQINSSIILQKS